ncbi:septation protein SepH, partial [Pseudofrankia sp. BMG5.36]|uniref:septation protein SepH n=2 Tax=unclassified Pseudofrankia TaxID=2994372 RepID=UPI0008D9C614
MRELRAVALSEDGGYLVLADANGRADAEQFRVPVDDRLRAALRGARRSEVRTESALTPREIQARLRAGETAADVARAAGIPVERVERYEGPVLAERARVVQEARAALLPKDPGGASGRPLGEVVDTRLMAGQDDPEAAQWDAWRRVDGIWLVQLTSESRCARWTWDPVVRRVRPHDDAARALVAPEPVDTAPAASTAPGAAAAPPTRQSPPALTLVQDPAQPPAGARPLPAHPAAPQPEQRPRYAQPASYPEPGYPDSHDPAGPFPGPGQPAAPFPAAPAHQEPRYPAAHHPAARYPAAQHPAEHQPPAARQRADDFDHAAGRPADRYQAPPAYQPPQPPPEQYPPTRYSTDPYPPDTFAPAHYPTASPRGGDLPAARPDVSSPGSPYADDLGGPPSFDEAFNDPFDTGRAEPAGPAGAPPAAAAHHFPDRLAGRGGQPTTDDLDLGRPFDRPAGRPARPAPAHRPARPPALESRPTGPLEPRRWPGHDDPDLGMGLDADLFDEPADQLDPPTPAASRPLPRPATAPPRGASAPPRAMPPRSTVPPRPETRGTPQGPARPAPSVPASAAAFAPPTEPAAQYAPRADARDAGPALGRPGESPRETAAPQ